MVDDRCVLTDAPQRPTPHKAWEVTGLFLGEAEQFGGVGDLVGGLLEEDPSAGVTEEPGGDLVGRGAVGGLGAQVGEAVADEDVADPPVSAQLEPGLKMTDRPLIDARRNSSRTFSNQSHV